MCVLEKRKNKEKDIRKRKIERETFLKERTSSERRKKHEQKQRNKKYTHIKKTFKIQGWIAQKKSVLEIVNDDLVF